MAAATADTSVNDVNQLWELLLWVGKGIVALAGVLLGAFIGNIFKEHKILVDDYKQRNSPDSKELKILKEEEDKKMKLDVNTMAHKMAGIEVQIREAFNKMERVYEREDKLLELEHQILSILKKAA